jgi:hypothetical protein
MVLNNFAAIAIQILKTLSGVKALFHSSQKQTRNLAASDCIKLK